MPLQKQQLLDTIRVCISQIKELEQKLKRIMKCIKLEEQNLDNPQKPQLNKPTASGSFYGIGEMCKRCSGDGWVFHSKGGRRGLMKDCPKCEGKGVIKNYR